MCGIVGAIADRDVVPLLIEGLRRLEYRGYDSAGVAVLDASGQMQRRRTVGKVRMLEDALETEPARGCLGIAHTRWATHGVPSERNAHPHISRDGIAIVHNGIIENHDELRNELKRLGYAFESETDTEVIAHRIHFHRKVTGDLFKAVRATVAELEGAFALSVISSDDPDRIVLARQGCPVVIGLGDGENFVASDVAALLPVTRRFMFLEEGDVGEIRRTAIRIIDKEGNKAQRPEWLSEQSADAAEKGEFPHYMLKEIFEQPRAVAQTLEGRVVGGKLLEAAFGPAAQAVFAQTQAVPSLPAARASMPPPWRDISSSRSAGYRAGSRSRANTVIATRSYRRTRCSSAYRSRARPPTRSRRCEWQSRPATFRSSPSATCRKARWCASRNW